MTASKRRGTAWESALRQWFRQHGFPQAERRTLTGANDCGDLNLGVPVVIEAKDCARFALSEWLTEAEIETENARADFGFVIVKRRNHSVGDAYVLMELNQLAPLLKRLYG